MQRNAQTVPRLIRFRSQNTRKNLPAVSAGKRGETNFLRAFEKAYLGIEAVGGVAGREFALEGYGRADLVWLAYQSGTEAGEFKAMELRRVRFTAIEGKLTDWRKGLQQAYRYRYFAHRALLVLPPATSRIAAEYLPTFRRLKVGLWSFDASVGRLRKFFTPRITKPLNVEAHEKAIQFLTTRLDFGLATK